MTPQQLAEALGSFIAWLKQRTGGTVVIVVRLPDGNTIAGWDSLDSPETAREVLEAAARAVPLSPKAPGHVLQ